MTRFLLGLAIFVLGAAVLAHAGNSTKVQRSSDHRVKSEVKPPRTSSVNVSASKDSKDSKRDRIKSSPDSLGKMFDVIRPSNPQF